MPAEVVLRRLVDSAVTGGFPAGAFVNATGDEIDPLDIYMSFRFATASILEGVSFRGRILYATGRGQLIHEVLISVRDLQAFCVAQDTRPPPGLRQPRTPWWRRAKRQAHIVPPPCPGAEQHAVRIDASRSARALLGQISRALSRARGEAVPHRHEPDLSPLDPDSGTRWDFMKKATLSEIDRCGEADLRPELEALEAEWIRLVEQARIGGGCEPGSAWADSIAGVFDTGVADDNGTAAFPRPGAATPAEVAGRSEGDQRPVVPKAPRLVVNLLRQAVVLDGREISLSPRPLKLIVLLAEAAKKDGRVVPRREIEEALWGKCVVSEGGIADAVRDLRRQLRQRTGPDPKELIGARTSIGYILMLGPEAIEIVR